jgi:hypothetical protein
LYSLFIGLEHLKNRIILFEIDPTNMTLLPKKSVIIEKDVIYLDCSRNWKTISFDIKPIKKNYYHISHKLFINRLLRL